VDIFGSYARCEASPESDLDIVVEFKTAKSLLEMVGEAAKRMSEATTGQSTASPLAGHQWYER
jgi:predicted nucleotidyltransferase